jgi:protein-S-isoprenylcysteine O-methyltransferase Ste14
MDTVRYVLAVLTVITLPPAVVWWYLVHPFVGFWRKIGPAGTITTMAVLSIAAMVGLFGIRERLLGRDLGFDGGRTAVGVLLLAASVMIMLRRRRHLTSRILSGVPELQAGGGGTLLTQGIYGVIRHPRYVEVALGTFGYALFANYVGLYVVALLTVLGLHGIVLLEERELEQRFGEEYRAWAQRVPRYLPRRRPVGAGDP